MGSPFFGPFVGPNAASIFDGSRPSAPSSGGSEVFGGRAAAPADSNFAASFQRRGSCTEELLRAMQYREVTATADGTNNFAADSPQVPDDKFWFVLGVTGALSQAGPLFNNQAQCGLFLMPPNAVGSPPPPPGQVGIFAGIEIDLPNNIGGNFLDAADLLFTGRSIVVPPRWFLRLMSLGTGSGISSAGAVYALRWAFAELPLSFDALELL